MLHESATGMAASNGPAIEPATRRGWSFSFGVLDAIPVVLAILASLGALHALGLPLVEDVPPNIFPLDWVWSFAWIAWAYSVYHDLETDEANRYGRLLLGLAFACLGAILPYAALRYGGLLGGAALVAAFLTLLALVILNEQRRNAAWLIVPAIAIVTVGLAAAGFKI
jgi:hypothetical protein